MRLQENVVLAPLTTLRVGGPARYFVEARSVAEIEQAVALSRSHNLPLFILGGGSNLVVSDAGCPGLVVKVAISGIEQHGQDDHGHTLFTVGAGEGWDNFVNEAVRLNCAGVECLSGIPGSVGATPVQNVGAYGQEVSDTIQCVEALDLHHSKVKKIFRDECGFAYRSSIFNKHERDRYIILRVTYGLISGGAPRLEYADLKIYFANQGRVPSLAEVREAVLEIRARKGMVIIEGDPDCRSAGSFFKNPVLSESQHSDLVRRAGERGQVVPSYPTLESQRKVSAAWLVEHSGLTKGFTLRQAAISSKHALAIVNRGGASACEILALKNEIQRRVEQCWGVRLEPEPVFLGF